MNDFSKKRGISKTIFYIVYCICVYVAALAILSSVLNRGNADMTMEMTEATFPVVNFRYDGFDLTSLHGYAQEMDVSSMRDNLTPLKADRNLSFRINTYGKVIGSVRYELRSMDGSRLIEDGDVTNYLTDGNYINAGIVLKDLMEKGLEYSLCIIVQTPEREAIRYYTRVVCLEKEDPYAMLTFAFNFSNKTFDKANAQKDIQMYLESNDQGDNSTLHKVTIHSSFHQVTWGDLKIERVTSPQASILDMDMETATIRLDYMVMGQQDGKDIYYRIKEYYRMRKGDERMYLLDFERTMDQIFNYESSIIANNKFVLGITDEDVEMMESPDSNRIAFVSEGSLYGYNITDNKLALIYSYYTDDMLDARTTFQKHKMRIFSVDETGNVEFMVYGYHNRGEHEGEVGAAFFYYNAELNTVEEQLYIPYNRSFERLDYNLKIISYMNNQSKCYVYLDGTLYEFDLKLNKYSILAEDLKEDLLVSSEDAQMIAWVSSETEAKSIQMYNFQTFRKILISAAAGEYLRPIGFFGDDLVYGIARENDITEDIHGNTLFPMYKIVICDENNRVRKEYQENGYYIVDTEMTQGMVSLTRMYKNENGEYTEALQDQILNNAENAQGRNRVETVITDLYEKIVQLAVKSEINRQQMQVLTPRFVMHEGGSSAELVPAAAAEDNYYVLCRDDLLCITKKTYEAVSLAYEVNGSVMNAKGQLVYDRAVRPVKNQIMAIGAVGPDEDQTAQKADCLNTLLRYAGRSVDVTADIRNGKNAVEILAENLPDKEVLNLSGCPLDAALSYVAKEKPVLVELTDGGAYLLVGYNEYNTVVLDPQQGEIYKIGMNDSTVLFEANGNRFITYQ